MSQIDKNSILFSYQVPLHVAVTNPNHVVIADGLKSIPTGRLADFASSRSLSSQNEVIVLGSAQSPESTFPVGTGMQIFDKRPNSQDIEECCCECCREEPETPAIWARPVGDCSCPRARKQLIGVFIDGIVQPLKELHPADQEEDDSKSGMRYLCQKYGGPEWRENGSESWLYRGLRLPSGMPIVEDVGDQAERIFEELKKRICENHRWDGKVWIPCNRIDIDLFGYSRGGATAVLVAKKLGEKWSCDDCPQAGPLGPFTVRFLGIIDPATVFLPKLFGPFTHKAIPGTDEVPDNVRYFFQAYTDADHVHDVVSFKEPGTPGSRLENASSSGDWHLPHRKMDDYELGPIEALEEYFGQIVVDPPLADSDKPSCEEKV